MLRKALAAAAVSLCSVLTVSAQGMGADSAPNFVDQKIFPNGCIFGQDNRKHWAGMAVVITKPFNVLGDDLSVGTVLLINREDDRKRVKISANNVAVVVGGIDFVLKLSSELKELPEKAAILRARCPTGGVTL